MVKQWPGEGGYHLCFVGNIYRTRWVLNVERKLSGLIPNFLGGTSQGTLRHHL